MNAQTKRLKPSPLPPWFIQEMGELHGDEPGIELAVIHRSNTHGQESYGWPSATKVLLTGYEMIETKAELTFYRKLARILCDGLNTDAALTRDARRLSRHSD